MIERNLAAVAPDLLQLHGAESVERVAEVRRRFGVPVMKAIKVETAADAEAALAYMGVADRILFDAKAPKGLAGALPGGNGLSFDWRMLEGVRDKLDFMLSGGLTAETVAEAVRLTGAPAVDVSSGVESRPGEKDKGMIARFLAAEGVTVVEVDRPDRQTRRDQGKSDSIDAYAAARAAASGRAAGTPKSRVGDVESVRVLRVARTGAVRARAKALTQLKSLIVTAPDTLRAQLTGLDGARLVTTCTRLRPNRGIAPTPSTFAKRPPRPGRLVDPTAATKRALAAIAGRVQQLNVEIAELDDDLEALITPLAPALLALQGVGLDVAGQLLVTAGDNPDRVTNEAAFAHLCGVAPIPASSGKTAGRHRLNRGGDRAAGAEERPGPRGPRRPDHCPPELAARLRFCDRQGRARAQRLRAHQRSVRPDRAGTDWGGRGQRDPRFADQLPRRLGRASLPRRQPCRNEPLDRDPDHRRAGPPHP